MSTAARLPPLKETVGFVNELAHNARLDNPLPADTDFTDQEFTDVQAQLNALTALPPAGREYIYIAFSAKQLSGLVRVLRTLSRTSQRRAFSTLVQILSLLEDPKRDPYFRRFLRSPQVAGLPTLVAAAFVEGVDWLRPSGPGHICSLIMHMLQCCDPTLGDDAKASVDGATRQRLAEKVAAFVAQPDFARLERLQQSECRRLLGMLHSLENLPGPPGGPPGWLMISSYEHLIGTIPGQEECDVCMAEEDTAWCSRCRTVKYCGTECQTKAWKSGHKLRCFDMVI